MQGVFDPSLPDGRAAATLAIVGNLLVADSPEGGGLAVPLAGLQLEVGGADGDVVFCRHPDHPGRCLFGRGAAMRALLLPHVDAGGRALLERKLRTGPRSVWPGLLLFVGGVALLVWLLTASVGLLAPTLPMSVDQSLGKAVKPLVLSDAAGKVVTDPAVVAPVRAIMERVVSNSVAPGLEFDLTIVEDKTINAFALPGGVIVVYTGLLDRSASPDEVAAVLAHEWTHVTARHGMRKIGQSLGLVALVELALGDVAGVIGTAAELFSLAEAQSYGRELEEESDAEAVRILARAGLDPLAVATFFEALAARSPEALPGAFDWLSTHPSHQERIANARALAASTEVAALRPRAAAPLPLDWTAVQAALDD